MESWTEWTDPNFFDSDSNQTFDLNELEVDQAYVYVKNNVFNHTYYLYWNTIDCLKCPFKKLSEIAGKVLMEVKPENSTAADGAAAADTTTAAAPRQEGGAGDAGGAGGAADKAQLVDVGPKITAIPIKIARSLDLRLTSEDQGQYYLDDLTDEKKVWKTGNGYAKLGQFGVYNLTIGESKNDTRDLEDPCGGGSTAESPPPPPPGARQEEATTVATVLDIASDELPSGNIFWTVSKEPVNIYTCK